MFFKSEIVFVRILIPFCLGISLFYFLPDAKYIAPLYFSCAFLFCLLIFLNVFYLKLNLYKIKYWIGISLFLFFFALGGLLCLNKNQKLFKHYFGHKNEPYLQIIVDNEPQLNNDILRFKANVVQSYHQNKRRKSFGKILIALKVDTLKPIQINYGDECLIAVKYFEVEPPGNPYEFDFKDWLAQQNIYHQAFINQNQIVKVDTNKGNPILDFALKLRQKQIEKYKRLIQNKEAFAVASTLVLGYRADLSKETLAAYSKTGTIHALSVSGAHVGLIFAFLSFFLRFLNRNKRTKIAKVIIICSLIWGYALLTGFSPSVLRSVIMLSIFIIAKNFNQNTNSYNVFAFSAFMMLIYNPFFIWDVGFQLSYLAVFGLIYLQPKIQSLWYIENKQIKAVWDLIALSFAAQIVTFPLSIFYFHQFPIYFLFSNLFIALPLTLMMYLGIAVLIPCCDFIAFVFEWIIVFTNQSLKWISNLPLASLSGLWIHPFALLLLSLALGFFIYAIINANKKLLFASLVLCLGFQICIAYDYLEKETQRKIIFFSLRKNYAVAFIQNRNAILLSDLNPKDRNYLFFVAQSLEQLKIKNLTIIPFEKDTTIRQFSAKQHQIHFFDYKILLADSCLNHKSIVNTPYFDAVWVHGNIKLKLDKFKPKLNTNWLLIDATNKEYKIEWNENEAKRYGLKSYRLKKNKALEINLS